MKLPSFIKELGNVWMLKDDDSITREILACKKLAWDETFRPIFNQIRFKRGTVVDIGAYIGDSADWFSGSHRLICMEPAREAFMCLNHNLKDAWNIPFPAGNGEIVSVELKEFGNIGSRSVSNGSEVRTIRLDDLDIKDIVFLKIDAEGWEPKVLQGAEETINKYKPLVMIEFNGPALEKNGFTFNDISKFFDGWNKQKVYQCGNRLWDTLFSP